MKLNNNENYSGKAEPGYLFGNNLYSVYYGGLRGEIPSWEEFYKNIGVECKMPMSCVAGCDSTDKTRMTLTIFPSGIFNMPKELTDTLVFNVSDTVDNNKLYKIINDIVNNYRNYKALYL